MARLQKLSRAGRLCRADKLLVRRTRLLFWIRSSWRADDFMVSGWVASRRTKMLLTCVLTERSREVPKIVSGIAVCGNAPYPNNAVMTPLEQRSKANRTRGLKTLIKELACFFMRGFLLSAAAKSLAVCECYWVAQSLSPLNRKIR